MKTIILSTAIACALAANSAVAGATFTTVNSRANCINNESITWWLYHPYNWRVVGVHYDITSGRQHGMDTGYQYTWRSAAVHWGEGPLNYHNWVVTGYHYQLEYAGGRFPFDTTVTGNCSIYDGWWDS